MIDLDEMLGGTFSPTTTTTTASTENWGANQAPANLLDNLMDVFSAGPATQ